MGNLETQSISGSSLEKSSKFRPKNASISFTEYVIFPLKTYCSFLSINMIPKLLAIAY